MQEKGVLAGDFTHVDYITIARAASMYVCALCFLRLSTDRGVFPDMTLRAPSTVSCVICFVGVLTGTSAAGADNTLHERHTRDTGKICKTT